VFVIIGPFSASFGKFGHMFFRQIFFFFKALFELFGRNFGHLATLETFVVAVRASFFTAEIPICCTLLVGLYGHVKNAL
jgi:hypothetical protein